MFALEKRYEQAGGAPSAADDEFVTRSPAGYTLEVNLLMTVCDLIQQLNSTLIGVNLPKGKRPPKVHPMPRAVTALDVLRRRSEAQEVDTAVTNLLAGQVEITE